VWCPEGYLRWDEFRDACRAASRRFLVRRYGAMKAHTWGAPVDHSAEGPYARKDKQHAVANWLMSVALHEGIFSCASPSGRPVRIETKRFAPTVFADDIATAEIFCSDTSPWRPTDWDDAPPAWWKVWSRPHYLFIDDETGTILNPSEVTLQNFADKFADQYCYECHGELDTPSTRDNLKGWLHFELSDARALASQFEGQVLCIRADLADQFTASAFDGWQPDNSTAVGAGLRDAYLCFTKAYPHGKGTATWPEVEKVTGYSRRQIVRAMKKYSG